MIIDFVRKHLVLNFSQLIGQEVVVRFLKNTLYKNYFFPLYLFSGPRGTGKTSSARLLATAYFCEQYNQFCNLKDNVIIPCRQCATCIETLNGKNPNLIEIDAASNTGVDNIRALIENAYLMPIDSNKKFYIIDEAHMLSKSAFNACLKIMEEPPEHVHFIMATTEPQKILDTIRSRSIHLHFKPLTHNQLAEYICSIAKEENVELEYSGAYLISTFAEGSIRDALNTLTKLCIIYGSAISEEMVRNNCGIITKETIHMLVDCILFYEKEKFSLIIQELKNEPIDKKILFEQIIEYVLEKIHEKEKKNIINFMQLLYKEERYFLESFFPLYILEIWMYTLHNAEHLSENNSFINQIIKNNNEKAQESLPEKTVNNIILLHEKTPTTDTSNIFKETMSKTASIDLHNSFDNKIDNFLNELMNKEKAVGAIIKSALIKYDALLNTINCYFDPHVSFYIDFINNKIDVIKPILQSFFDPTITLHFSISTKPREKEENIVIPLQKTSNHNEKSALHNALNTAKTTYVPEKKTGYQHAASSSSGISKYGFIKKKVMSTVFTKGSLGEEIVKTFPGVTYEEKNNIK